LQARPGDGWARQNKDEPARARSPLARALTDALATVLECLPALVRHAFVFLLGRLVLAPIRARRWRVLSAGEAVGVETAPNALQKVSFDHLREPAMERELDAASRAFERMPSFGGFVIHHYAAYRRWLSR
jgi:hypothetical protein